MTDNDFVRMSMSLEDGDWIKNLVLSGVNEKMDQAKWHDMACNLIELKIKSKHQMQPLTIFCNGEERF
jgi:hypothetical protein